MAERREATCACGRKMVQVVEQSFVTTTAGAAPRHVGWTCSCRDPRVSQETVVFEPDIEKEKS